LPVFHKKTPPKQSYPRIEGSKKRKIKASQAKNPDHFPFSTFNFIQRDAKTTPQFLVLFGRFPKGINS